MVGLAPGLHGANRTGRPFTGDHAGILLYRTLHGAGFASRAESSRAGDGLRLVDCRISNAVKCLPPGNKPRPDEVRRCNRYLVREIAALAPGAVVVALGAIAHGAVLQGAGAETRRLSLRARRGTRAARRAHAPRFLPLQPAQHEHRPPDAGHVRARLRAGAPLDRRLTAATPWRCERIRRQRPSSGACPTDRACTACSTPTGRIVYVGKASGLRSRVGSYFRADQLQPKVQALVRVVAGIEVTVTNSDTEALLLEHNLIKTHRPRFNVILRDDKSFPYVHLSAHEFPRLSFYRGSRKLPGRLFGPYPSASAVHETLNQLHKLFRLRSCKDTFFANRSRPCLEYQIGRCSAPCTGLIDAAAYARDVESVAMVLDGRTPGRHRCASAPRWTAPRTGSISSAPRMLRDQLAATDRRAGTPGRDARARRDGHRRDRRGGGGRRVLRRAHVRARRPGARHVHLSPARTDQRRTRSAGGFPRAALPRAGCAAPHLPVARGRGLRARSQRRCPSAFGPPGPHRRGTARLSAALGRARAAECGRTHCRCARRRRRASRSSSRNCGSFSGIEASRSSASSASTSATRRVRRRTHPASCSRPTGPVKADYRRYNIEDVERGDDYGALRQALAAPLSATQGRRNCRCLTCS